MDVSVSYRGRAALQDVSCVVRPGEVAVLVGPNGSGKSTLLRVLARALRPERGAVRLGQRNVAALSSAEYARRVAYVSQEHVVGFGFSVAEHVRLGRVAFAEGRRLPPLPEILEALDLEALRSRSLLSLSGGERQRAFVARALAQDADHLLLDEPTAHLDLRHQVALLEVVREAAHERGKGALLVLHDLDLAARYADNLLLLHQGRLAAAGAAESVLTPERIRAVYQTNVYLFTHPATGRPSVTALPGRGADGGTATPNLTFP